ncbi:hypothetical protein MMC07_001527 [Pseudocyphellaria aurata]|nr:hypothetical protein [Pseudocyphellaria aurata]
MINDEMKLTFGVEFECVLAFHQSLLQAHLDNISDSSAIVKNLTEVERIELRTGGLNYMKAHAKYMGWALTSEPSLPASQGYDPHVECHRKFGIRPYSDEILHVAKRLLPLPTDVQCLRTQGKRMDFSKWHLSEDASLLGVDKDTMRAKLGGRIVDVESWDSHGIELISRILPPTPASFAEISNNLTILQGTSSSLHGAFTTSLCGFHVHVGLPVPITDGPLPTFDLPTLQHLAYILVMYEAKISTLHAPSRRAGSMAAEIDIVTNLDIFSEATLAENLANEDEFDWDSWSASAPPSDASAESNEAWEEERVSYAVTRRLIFARDLTVAKLSNLMCGNTKGHIVNFTYLAREDGFPRTVEFRQHEGSLDPEAVRWWILFVTGLVKLAAHMAKQFGAEEDYAGEGYPQAENLGRASLEELWTLMDFEQGGREFFRRKIKHFAQM